MREVWRRRNRRASTSSRILALVVVLVVGGPLVGPVSSATAVPLASLATAHRTPATSQDSAPSAVPAQRAQAAAEAARAQVDALLQHYQDASVQVDAGLTQLTTAFADAAGAEATDDQAAAQARRARAWQTEQVRALYASGGPLSLTATILDATSPEDALWRASTADQALATVFASTASQVKDRAGLAILTQRRAEQADAATQAQARALNLLQQRSAVAATALDQARQTLAALNTRARDAAAALASERQIAAAQAATAKARATAIGPVSAIGIPTDYLKAYQDAATTCPGMSWTLLAAVGQVESGQGHNEGPSSAGAIGPMQFLPATFDAYAVDGDHDGVLSAWDPPDAIFTAAHYLCVAGAEGGSAAGIHAALLTYNHAEWYVQLVLAAQQAIIARQAALSSP